MSLLLLFGTPSASVPDTIFQHFRQASSASKRPIKGGTTRSKLPKDQGPVAWPLRIIEGQNRHISTGYGAKRRVIPNYVPPVGDNKTDPFHIRIVTDITRARLPVGDRGSLRHGMASIPDTPRTDQFKFRIVKGDGPRRDHGRIVNRKPVIDREPISNTPRNDPFEFRYASGISHRKDWGFKVLQRGCAQKFTPPFDLGVFGHNKIRQIPGASNRKDYARIVKRTEVAENFTVLHQPRADIKAPSPRIPLAAGRGSVRRSIPHPPGVPWQAPYTPRRLRGGLPIQLKREIAWGAHRFGPGAREIKTYIPLDFSRLLIEVGYETQATIDMTYPITVYVTVDHPDDVTMDLDMAV